MGAVRRGGGGLGSKGWAVDHQPGASGWTFAPRSPEKGSPSKEKGGGSFTQGRLKNGQKREAGEVDWLAE